MASITAVNEAEVAPATEPPASEWPLRPWVLAGLLGTGGLLIHLVSDGQDDVPWQMAIAAFLFFGSIAAAFTIDRDGWKAPALFALIAGLVMAGLAWRAVSAQDHYADAEYGFMAGVLATGLALPLFQSGFHRRRFATPYAQFHDHVWTDAISAAGALAFTGLAWLVLLIVSELFHLLKIDLLRDLMREGWFGWTYSGVAAGAALGTIRDELRLLGTLRTIVVLVLSLLAVPVAAALTIFLLSMLLSGPEVLWEATRSATPVLLACAAGAFVLTNTILRQDDAEMTRSRVMRVAALVLALAILPLTAFAAVSMGTRVAQHGLSPERLWGLIAIGVACLFGLAYLLAVVRGRGGGWRAGLRNTNLALAAGVSGLALLLALPILDFGGISARHQLARLERGAVSTGDFDYEALRWDFGDAGRRALAQLARSENADIAERARIARAQTARVYRRFDGPLRTEADYDLRVQPDDPVLRRLVLDYLRTNPWQCQERCVAIDLGPLDEGGRRVALVQGAGHQVLMLRPGTGGVEAPEVAPAAVPLQENSTVEVREVPTRYIFIDGKRLPRPLE